MIKKNSLHFCCVGMMCFGCCYSYYAFFLPWKAAGDIYWALDKQEGQCPRFLSLAAPIFELLLIYILLIHYIDVWHYSNITKVIELILKMFMEDVFIKTLQVSKDSFHITAIMFFLLRCHRRKLSFNKRKYLQQLRLRGNPIWNSGGIICKAKGMKILVILICIDCK